MAEDTDLIPEVTYEVKRDNGRHSLRLKAFHGSTQSTAFRNAQGRVIAITNANPDGFLGEGRDLRGKTLTIITVAQGDLPTFGVERIRLEYFIDDGTMDNQDPINVYDKSEETDTAPFLRFLIHFE